MNCENCGAEIKHGFLTSNRILTKETIKLINDTLNLNSETYCEACGNLLLKETNNIKKQFNERLISIHTTLHNQLSIIENEFGHLINKLPVITTHSPYRWEYTTLSLVSGQNIIGTGFLSEILSDFTDFFGTKSNSFSNKIRDNEEYVLNQLRAKAIRLGGNAVIGTDIDYGEVGAHKGMLMVCAAGTAVKLNNIEVLEEETEVIEKIQSIGEQLVVVDKLLKMKDISLLDAYSKYKTKYMNES